MKQEKKRQHYVFQAYLRKWASDQNRLYFLDKSNSNIRPALPKDILFEKFFYEIPRLSDSAQFFLENLMTALKIGPFGKLLFKIFIAQTQYGYTLLEDFKSHFLYKKIPLGESLYRQLAESIDKENKRLMEDFHQEWEKIGTKYLNKLIELDSDFYYKDTESREEFLFFVSLQFTRTLKQRSAMVNIVGKLCGKDFLKFNLSDQDYKAVAPYIQRVITHAIHASFIRMKPHLTILKNSTSIPFLTSDQPMFSIGDNTENDGYIYFYPISPSIAITINEEQIDNIQEIEDSNKILHYNNRLYEKASRFVISNEERSLHNYINKNQCT